MSLKNGRSTLTADLGLQPPTAEDDEDEGWVDMPDEPRYTHPPVASVGVQTEIPRVNVGVQTDDVQSMAQGTTDHEDSKQRKSEGLDAIKKKFLEQTDALSITQDELEQLQGDLKSVEEKLLKERDAHNATRKELKAEKEHKAGKDSVAAGLEKSAHQKTQQELERLQSKHLEIKEALDDVMSKVGDPDQLVASHKALESELAALKVTREEDLKTSSTKIKSLETKLSQSEEDLNQRTKDRDNFRSQLVNQNKLRGSVENERTKRYEVTDKMKPKPRRAYPMLRKRYVRSNPATRSCRTRPFRILQS